MDYNTSSGLFTAHNSTLPSALFWLDGSKVKVDRYHEAIRQKGGGSRSKVRGFSKGSRKRLMRKMGELNRGQLPFFATLTFPDDYYPYVKDYKHWKKVLKRFEARFRRNFPEAGYIWRLEFQSRKSGQYIGTLFPHFHLLVYGIESITAFRVWVSMNWYQCVGSGNRAHLNAGTNVKQIENAKGLFCYVSKYLAKVDQLDFDTGRIWGVVCVENLPWVKAVLVKLEEKEAVQLIRYLRRFAHIKGRDLVSLTVLLDASQWWNNLDRLLYPE